MPRNTKSPLMYLCENILQYLDMSFIKFGDLSHKYRLIIEHHKLVQNFSFNGKKCASFLALHIINSV